MLLIFSWSLWLSFPSLNKKKSSANFKQKLIHSETNAKTRDPFTEDLNNSKMLQLLVESKPVAIKAKPTQSPTTKSDEKLNEQNKKMIVQTFPTPEIAIKAKEESKDKKVVESSKPEQANINVVKVDSELKDKKVVESSKPEQANINAAKVDSESKDKKTVELKPEQANVNVAKVDSEKKEEPKEKKIDLSFPVMADATSKALIAIEVPKEVKPDTSETVLRKQVIVNKPKQPVSGALMLQDDPLLHEEGWLSQHLESMEIANKTPEQNNKPEHLFGQIELSELINSPNGEQSFVLKDNSTNVVRVLTKGQLYKGFRVDEIRQNEVVFINVIQNRKYFKPLAPKN